MNDAPTQSIDEGQSQDAKGGTTFLEGDNLGQIFNGSIGNNANLGTIGDYANYGVINEYYSNKTDIIEQQSISSFASETSVKPDGLPILLQLLKANKLILLQAPEFWGHQHVAKHLVAAALELLPQTRTENDEAVEPVEPEIWVKLGDVTGRAIIQTLEARHTDKDETNKVARTVLYLPDVDSANYDKNTLNRLQSYAADNQVYIVLTSTQLAETWEKALGQDYRFVYNLEKNSPYTGKNLADWACNIFKNRPEILRLLQEKEIVSPEIETIQPDTPLAKVAGVKSLQELIEAAVHTPGTVLKLDIYIRDAKSLPNLVDEIRKATEDQDKRLQEWFKDLDEDLRYMVLAIGLVNDLPDQTFWAIYEQLIGEHWRRRNQSLQMRDYLEIERSLSEFIQIDNGQIGFKDSDSRRKIIDEYALKSYRRSLVNALPFMAGLLTRAETPPGDLSNSIAAMEIWGSDLAPRQENRDRRQRLRNSLIASIVDIDRHEPVTTEYILQAWAETPFYNNELRSISLPFKQAFSDVLIQMYQRKTITASTWKGNSQSTSYWNSRRSLNLIETWYNSIQREKPGIFGELSATSQINQRRQQIRRTLVYAICNFARSLPVEDFGEVSDAAALLQNYPARQPRSSELKSLWHMLVAFAWEADPLLRLVIADSCSMLYDRHQEHLYQLLYLLASDWDEDVRLQIASLLAQLYRSDSKNIQIIHHLLNLSASDTVRRKISDKNHYLRAEAARHDDTNYPLHYWTASVAMLLISTSDEGKDVFRSYLKTMINNAGNAHHRAFKAACEKLSKLDIWLNTTNEVILTNIRFGLGFGDHRQIFNLILKDRMANHLLSEPARTLNDVLKNAARKKDYLGYFLSNNDEQNNFKNAQDPERLRNYI